MSFSSSKKSEKFIYLAFFTFLSVFLFSLTFIPAHAGSTLTWDNGATGDNNWSSANNWSPNTAPTSGTKVVFDGTSTADSNINTTTVDEILMKSSYTGTVSSSVNLTVNNTVTITGGTFDANGNTTTIQDLLKLNGSGAKYLAGDKTQYLQGGLEISAGTFKQETASLKLSNSDWIVNGGEFVGNEVILSGDIEGVQNWTISSGTVTSTNGEVYVINNIDFNGGTFNHNGGWIKPSGSVTTTILSSNAGNFDKFNFTKNSDLALEDTITVEDYIDFYSFNPTLDARGNDIKMNGADFGLGASDTYTYKPNGGKLIFTGGPTIQEIESVNQGVFNSIIINGSDQSSGFEIKAGDLTMTGDLVVNTGTLRDNGNEINFQGSSLDAAGSDTDLDLTGTTTFSGSGTQTVTSSGNSFNKIKVNQQSGSDTLSLQDALAVSSTFSMNTGTFDANDNTSTIEGLAKLNNSNATYKAGNKPQNFENGLRLNAGTYDGESNLASPLTHIKGDNLYFSGGTMTSTNSSTLQIDKNAKVDISNAGQTTDLFTSNILTASNSKPTSTTAINFHFDTTFDVGPNSNFQFTSGTKFSISNETKQDFTQVKGNLNVSSTPSSLDVKSGMKFGIDGVSMETDQTSTGVLGVTPSLAGETLSIYKKTGENNWQDTGKTCKVPFEFELSAPCTFQTQSFSQFTAATGTISNEEDTTKNDGGGGATFSASGSNPPEVESGKSAAVLINSGDSKTTDRNVTLTFNVSNATQLAVSEDQNFSGASFQNYPSDDTMNYTLSNQNEQKTVYVRFQSSAGQTLDSSDSIELINSNQNTDDVACTMQYDPVCGVDGKTYSNSCVAKQQNNVDIKHKGECTEQDKNQASSCPLTPNQAYTSDTSNAVYYITKECTKRPFRSSEVYSTYFDSWSDTNLTDQSILDQIQNDNLGFMPWGSNKNIKAGQLFKSVNDPKVYIQQANGNKCWIKNEQVFKALNYSFANIWDIHSNYIEQTPSCDSPIDYTDRHPNYTLIKYPNSNDVYMLQPNENGTQVKRLIENMQVFKEMNLSRKDIITVETSEQYPDGQPLN